MSTMLPTPAGSQGQQVSTTTSDTTDCDKSGDMVAMLWHQMEDGFCRLNNCKKDGSEWNASFDIEIWAMEELKSKLSERLVSSKRTRNAAAPLHQLPTEIFLEILRLCLPPEDKAQARERTSLALVCYYWHAVVQSSPTLWSTICSADTIVDVSRALVNSKETQLNIIGFWIESHTQWSPSYLQDLSNAQGAFFNEIVIHKFLTGAAAPQLEYLSLAMPRRRWTGTEALNLFNGRSTPRLRYLSLDGVPIKWNTLSSPNLATLAIRNIRNLGPSLSQLLGALSFCSRLTSLSITWVPSLEDSVPVTGPVALPRLQKLVIESLGVLAVHNILGNLQIPAHCQVHLQLRVRGDPKVSLFRSDLSHLFQFCVANISMITVTFATTAFMSNMVRFQSDGLWSLDLTLDSARAVKGILVWCSSPEFSSGTMDVPVRIEFEGGEPRVDLFLGPLSGFENIRRITFRHDFESRSPSTILEYLSRAAKPDQHSRSLPFPGLEELHIEKPTRPFLQNITAMLKDRRTLCKVLGSPARLRRIILGSEHSGEEMESLDELWPIPLSKLIDTVNAGGIQLSWWGKQLTGGALVRSKSVQDLKT
ncbi:hypothetical protein FS837_011368 [Tulasnella sp. UAMH 9824]|nr:hypothetical protein FS837_011368 [Tulasnella sp. UAMH 9824]